jgi:D-alanine transaminase
MVDDEGYVTEGTASNAWIVNEEGTLVTRALSNDILSGITRLTVLRLAQELQIRIEERAFTADEAKAASEAFVTSASAFVIPVTQIDDTKLGEGRPGEVAAKLRAAYEEFMTTEPRILDGLAVHD